MTADQLRRLAVLIERTDYEAIDRAAAYLRACADALDAEPVAWMYPDDYERMKTSETFCTVFSVKVVSPDRGSTTVQLYPLAMPAAPTPPVQQDKPDMWLRQTSSERNPPHGWAVHFIPKDGDIPMFLKAQAPTPPVQQDDEAEHKAAMR